MKRVFLIAVFCLIAGPVQAAELPIKRELVAFFDSREESTVRQGITHRFLEMPANHLGYNIQYHDIMQPLPALKATDGVQGIVLWFYANMGVPDAEVFLDWLLDAHKLGKKIILIGNLGLSVQQLESENIGEKYQSLMQVLGLRDDMNWNPLTYEASIQYKNDKLVGFERSYGVNLPAFRSTHALPGATSHLTVVPGNGIEPADLIVTNKNGGYVAEDYFIFAHYLDEKLIASGKESYEIIQWLVNPFKFLNIALDAPFAPVPDVTTLNGRRIFYSHIDGDGWNNVSEAREYSQPKILSAEVMMREILIPYEDFSFTVGLITADVDPECYGVDASEGIAREIFQLPNVEPSSHTHSHPFYWRFFEDYQPQKEKPYLSKYPPRPKDQTSFVSAVGAYFDNSRRKHHSYARSPQKLHKRGRLELSDAEVMDSDFATPRSYACGAFDLEEEIVDSIKTVARLSPPDKEAVLIQWSGDTSPFEEALEITRKAGLLNINGGDSRFDREYPSYAWVAPIGLQINNERQIYSSNSNENTYTNLWTGRFFGFRYLQSTVANTESPLRISPFNMYFHMYSAEKKASLNALKDNLEYARSLPVIPIETSQYAKIANGFYATQIVPVGALSWKVVNRGTLGTVRLDAAEDYAVDLQKSPGILGFNYHANSLYIALDPAVQIPVITLYSNPNNQDPPRTPYLVESRWQINHLQKGENSLTFAATGYGNSEMVWKLAPREKYKVSVSRNSEMLYENTFVADENGVLKLHFDKVSAIKPVNISFKKITN